MHTDTRMTTYVPESMVDVRLCLGRSDDVSRIADSVPVTLSPGVKLPPTVRTVGNLRNLPAWPARHRLVIERQPSAQVRIDPPAPN
jgi:hypothetical protein